MVAFTVEEWIAQGNQITVLDNASKETVLSKKVSAKKAQANKTQENHQTALSLDGISAETLQKIKHYLAVCKSKDRDYDFGMYIGFLHGLEYANLIPFKHYETLVQWYISGVK